MNEIRLGEPVQFHDGPAIPVSAEAGAIKFLRPLTGQHESIHRLDLVLRLPEPAGGKTLVELTELTDEKRARLHNLAAHLRELHDGSPLIAGAETRPEYDPRLTTATARLRTKSEELKSLGFKNVSEPSLKRKKNEYLRDGIAALLDGRSAKTERPLGRADERFATALRKVMAAQTNRSTGSYGRLFVEVRETLLELYPGESVPLPSEAAFRRWVKALDAGRHTMGRATERRSVASVPHTRKRKARPAHAPGGEVQLDSTPIDAFIRNDDGKVERVHLTIAVDKATKSILGSIILPVATKGVDLALLLARCMVPPVMRPGEQRMRAQYPLPELPWAELLPPGERDQFDLARPFIVPKRVFVDNGADYVSRTFQDACEIFGISITTARPGKGSDKSAVESRFKAIREGFVEQLPGYVGPNTEMRGVKPETDTQLLDLTTMNSLFERWVTVVYQNRPQDGLRDPWHPGISHSPNSMYSALYPLTGAVPVPLAPDDYIGFLPFDERVIHSYGIRRGNRVYDSRELFELRELMDPRTGKPKRWRVRYDPYDPSFVWIANPEGGWIRCDWVGHEDALIRPFADTVYDTARHLAAHIDRASGFDTQWQTRQLINAAKKAQTEAEREERRAAAARARNTEIARLATATQVLTAEDDEWDGTSETFSDFDPDQEF